MSADHRTADAAASTSKQNASAPAALLDGLVYLRRPQKIPGFGDLASPARGWREHDVAEGEAWLRRRAEDGDSYAMQRLGLRMLEGDGVPRSPHHGVQWLKRAAGEGNRLAQRELARVERESASAELWFDMGGIEAAAADGSALATLRIGARLMGGLGHARDRAAGSRWLCRAGALAPSQMAAAGQYLYLKSLTRPGCEGQELREEAVVLLKESAAAGAAAGQILLAHLIRRGECRSEGAPPLEELLTPHATPNQPFALINQALRFAAGVQCTPDWRAADGLVARLQSADAVHEFWAARCLAGDAEGHLVVGWLLRHELAADPDGLTLPQRQAEAAEGGWVLPDWMSTYRRLDPVR
jgi:TPR repeat protein